jgi:pimeloyl-ACP methyl ester carboxylesterase
MLVMSTFVLLPGAGGSAWYWSRVGPLLEAAGHDVVAVDLPGDDHAAGLPEYTQAVLAAAADRTDIELVAQSLGAFTAAMVTAVLPVLSLTLVNAMIPAPGETPGAWWDNTGAVQARDAAAAAGGWGPFDNETYFLHDVPADVVAEGAAHQRPEVDAVFGSACAFTGWPAVPTRSLVGADDRFFPVDFQRALVRERLGLQADVLPGGHLIALAQPGAVADYLLRDRATRSR